jgi:hypothetical protein
MTPFSGPSTSMSFLLESLGELVLEIINQVDYVESLCQLSQCFKKGHFKH